MGNSKSKSQSKSRPTPSKSPHVPYPDKGVEFHSKFKEFETFMKAQKNENTYNQNLYKEAMKVIRDIQNHIRDLQYIHDFQHTPEETKEIELWNRFISDLQEKARQVKDHHKEEPVLREPTPTLENIEKIVHIAITSEAFADAGYASAVFFLDTVHYYPADLASVIHRNVLTWDPIRYHAQYTYAMQKRNDLIMKTEDLLWTRRLTALWEMRILHQQYDLLTGNITEPWKAEKKYPMQNYEKEYWENQFTACHRDAFLSFSANYSTYERFVEETTLQFEPRPSDYEINWKMTTRNAREQKISTGILNLFFCMTNDLYNLQRLLKGNTPDLESMMVNLTAAFPRNSITSGSEYDSILPYQEHIKQKFLQRVFQCFVFQNTKSNEVVHTLPKKQFPLPALPAPLPISHGKEEKPGLEIVKVKPRRSSDSDIAPKPARARRNSTGKRIEETTSCSMRSCKRKGKRK